MTENSRLSRRVAAGTRIVMGETAANGGDEERQDQTDDSFEHAYRDLDGTNASQVKLLIEDMEREVKKKLAIISAFADTSKQQQKENFIVTLMKMKKDVRHMKIRDYDKMHGSNILQVLREAANNNIVPKEASAMTAVENKKRIRDENNNGVDGMELETPAPNRNKIEPGTARTVRKGEVVFSQNGSPLEQVEEGTLVATLSKKRRGSNAAIFDINIGDGRYVNLADPGNMDDLDQETKDTAMSQLKVLQDQMASLMAQLGN